MQSTPPLHAPMILDHLTIASATPLALIAAAADAGFDGVGLFLHGMPDVTGMADFDLVHDRAARRACRDAAKDAGCGIAIAYPFTVSRTSAPEDFRHALDAAAELDARAINLLVFDRDRARRAETVASICADAEARGLQAGVEFYPLSAISSLDEALALCDAVPGLKITVDLLHLHRSGDTPERLIAHRDRVLMAQICDAPCAAPADLFAEASYARLLPGDGDLRPRALLDALGPHVPISIEAPVADMAHLPCAVLAQRARQAADRVLETMRRTEP
jgi:sugar phosphate isomerase/epimerase